MALQGSKVWLQGGSGVRLQPTGQVSGPSLSMGRSLQPTLSIGQLNATSKRNSGGNNDADSVSYATASPTGGASKATAANPKDLARFDQSEGIIKSSIGRLGNQLSIAKGNIGKNYETQQNELNSRKASSENQYNQSTTQNSQGYRTNKNAITDQSSSGLRGLMRMLGAYGAVGSDATLASGAVADQASQQRAGAGQNFAQNQQGLDTNWGSFLNEFSNSKKKLTDWRTEQEDSVEAESLTNKQDLLSKLADIRGQRAAAQGGDYAGSSQKYIDQARKLSGRIDSLGKISPRYTGRTPVYQASELDSYVTPEAQAAQMGGNMGVNPNNPYLSLLLGLQDEERGMF